MALEECPACSKEISINARSCPNCGEPLAKGWDVAVSKRRLKKHGWRTLRRIVVFLIFLPIIVSIFGNDDEPDSRKTTMPIPAAAKSVATPPPAHVETATTALGQMEQAFEGRLSQRDIKYRLDKALIAFGEPINDDTYRRAGSALVVMRKDTGVPEMDILRCIVASNAGQYGSFADMAAVCATILKR
tara:strand:+ start:17325 stop:17888 length:564 start_codon:yes stop_codon:yes gene_type:complete